MPTYSTCNITNNYFFQSKYISTRLFLKHALLRQLIFSSVLLYKQKYKLFLFIKIIYLLLFNNSIVSSSFYFKHLGVNILKVKLRSFKSIWNFLYTFVYIHFPIIDSFSSEFKYSIKNQVYNFCFFKFPIFFELNVIFSSLEYLFLFLNTYKFELQLIFKKQKTNSKNSTLLHMLKLPLLIT